MEFRPCIDIHNGQVKQIVGGSLLEEKNGIKENFVSKQDAVYYARLYKNCGIKGGHIIMLNAKESTYYDSTKEQALEALKAYPGGLQAGGSITDQNACEFLEAGASHVIVTSYVFRDGKIHYENLKKISGLVGKEHLVLDLSCKKVNEEYRIVTDRWQKLTDENIRLSLLENLAEYCDEFLIHAVDVEGKVNGIERELVKKLGSFRDKPITYAGGVHNFEDLKDLKELGEGRIHVTIGSALDIFGGSMNWEEVLHFISKEDLSAKSPFGA